MRDSTLKRLQKIENQHLKQISLELKSAQEALDTLEKNIKDLSALYADELEKLSLCSQSYITFSAFSEHVQTSLKDMQNSYKSQMSYVESIKEEIYEHFRRLKSCEIILNA